MDIEELEQRAKEAQEIFETAQGEWWASFGQAEVQEWSQAGQNSEDKPDVMILMERARTYAWKRVVRHFEPQG